MFPTKHFAKIALPQVIAALALVGTATAAVTLAYANSSPLALGVKAAPVVYSAGADGGVSDYVPSFAISTNATYFTSTIRGVPEATVTIDELLRVSNVDTRAHAVTISTSQVTNAFVTAYKLEFYDGATLVGTLDLKAASPSVTFPTLAAGKTLTAKATLALASGAGAHNVADARSLAMAVAS